MISPRVRINRARPRFRGTITVNRPPPGADGSQRKNAHVDRDGNRRFTAPDRSRGLLIWYRLRAVRLRRSLPWCPALASDGQRNIPAAGACCWSATTSVFSMCFFWEFLCKGRSITWRGRLCSSPLLGVFIRSVGGFPIQREGIGASGMKETLRRLKAGGIVALFPEGTRSPDGELGPLKPGIAALATRVGVPVVPAAVAGLFETWPRSRLVPVPHPVRIHYGQPILPHELAGLDTDGATELIRTRMKLVHQEAVGALRDDMYY